MVNIMKKSSEYINEQALAEMEEQKQIDEFVDQIHDMVDSHHGIYSASLFLEWYRHLITNADDLQEDIDFVMDAESNLESDGYWYAWINITDNAEIMVDGIKYYIYENEGIWLYPVDVEIPEGYDY